MLMQDKDFHLQRLLDGALAAPEAAGVQSQIDSDPVLRGRFEVLQALDGDLAASVRPLNNTQHQALLNRITDALPRHAPAVYASIRPSDIVLAASVLAMISICFATAGSIMHGSTTLVALACVGVAAGTFILILAAMLRRAERGLLRSLLGKSVALGPADLLIYRAIGIGLALGGLYLAHVS
jgi:hypothetical protein